MDTYGKFEIEFYNEVEDEFENPVEKRVKTKKMTGYKDNVEFYAQEQIDMGNYDSYIVYYVGTAEPKGGK